MNRSNQPDFGVHRYRRLWVLAVLITSVVTITALLVLNGVNYHQFERTLEAESLLEVEAMLGLTGETVERALKDRLAALRLLVQARSPGQLAERKSLSSLLKTLRNTYGDFTGLELRDAAGALTIGVGGAVPETDGESSVGVVTRIPGEGDRFTLAVRSEDEEGRAFRLTAAVDAELLAHLVEEEDDDLPIYTFLVSRDGLLQTPSRYCGGRVLEPCIRELPRIRERRAVFSDLDQEGYRLIWGHAAVADSP